MYIFELLTKLLKKEKIKTKEFIPEDIIEDSSECKHIFMPLDSSKEYFACKNCGLIISSDKLK